MAWSQICRAREQSLRNGELVELAAEVDTCLLGALGLLKKAELKLVDEWKQEAAEMGKIRNWNL